MCTRNKHNLYVYMVAVRMIKGFIIHAKKTIHMVPDRIKEGGGGGGGVKPHVQVVH